MVRNMRLAIGIILAMLLLVGSASAGYVTLYRPSSADITDHAVELKWSKSGDVLFKWYEVYSRPCGIQIGIGNYVCDEWTRVATITNKDVTYYKVQGLASEAEYEFYIREVKLPGYTDTQYVHVTTKPVVITYRVRGKPGLVPKGGTITVEVYDKNKLVKQQSISFKGYESYIEIPFQLDAGWDIERGQHFDRPVNRGKTYTFKTYYTPKESPESRIFWGSMDIFVLSSKTIEFTVAVVSTVTPAKTPAKTPAPAKTPVITPAKTPKKTPAPTKTPSVTPAKTPKKTTK